jgi:transposase
MVTCGIDWAQDHHDIAIVDTDGRLVAKRRIPESVAGFAELTAMLADAGDDPEDPIPVAIETPRGLLVAVLRASGRPIHPINPMSVARYRERTSMSGKKSDHADAVTLANILRTDAGQHRRLPADTELAQSITVLARAHQDATWQRTRAGNGLRSLLREFYPGFLNTFADRPGGITAPEARAVLAIAPTPAKAARLSKPQIVTALRRAGRQRGLATLAAAIQQQLRQPQLRQPTLVEDAFGIQAVAVLATLEAECASVDRLGEATAAAFTSTPTTGSSPRSWGSPTSPVPACSPKSVTTEHDSPAPER